MKNQKPVLIALLIGLTIVSCGKKTVAAVTTPASAKVEEVKPVAEVTEASIAEGKSIYEASCARCHKLFSPAKHTKEDWVGVLDRMAPKAKINEEQKHLVYIYLTNS